MSFVRSSVSLLIKIKTSQFAVGAENYIKKRPMSLVGFFQAEQLKQVIQAA